MIPEPMTLQYQRLRVPAADGGTLEIPALDQLPALLADNRRQLSTHQFSVNGCPIDRLRQSARAELVALASNYSRQYRNVTPGNADNGIVISGHQPTLFHPGVWFKNFGLHRLASDVQGVGANLLIDNDLCTSRSLAVPAGEPEHPRMERIPFDSDGPLVPFELQQLQDPGLFANFAQRVAKTLGAVVDRPLVGKLWPEVLDTIKCLKNPFSAIAAGRHRLESQSGLNTLELPLSHLCRTESFARFASDLLVRHRQLQSDYNQSLREYREVNRIRSSAHPVPELEMTGSWIETPFWVWSQQNSQRRRLFARSSGQAIELTDGDQWQTELETRQLTEGIAELGESGISLRPRALVTTMYARLVLSDLFLHGIGGAKYDQLTDQIIRRFFGVEPPEFAILTATCYLPLDLQPIVPADITHTVGRLRELRFHPETAVDSGKPGARELMIQKQRLLDKIPVSGSRRAWHTSITDVNHRMQPLVEDMRLQLARQLTKQREDLARRKILASREFAWCLFPDSLVKRLLAASG